VRWRARVGRCAGRAGVAVPSGVGVEAHRGEVGARGAAGQFPSEGDGILDIAAGVLAERGEAASTVHIADAAGVGRATLYRYFPTGRPSSGRSTKRR
jgi:tetracycline repressor-like protein